MAIEDEYEFDLDLKNRGAAALLAWLVPGMGHLYQGRTSKGIAIFISVSLLFITGLQMSGGKVVYCSFRQPDIRWQFLGQSFVGSAAIPAVIQNRVVRGQEAARETHRPLFGGKFSPPTRSERIDWHADYHAYFQMGTLYTFVAGLLNMFAIFDAACGPMVYGAEFIMDDTDDTDETDDTEGEEVW